MEWFKDIDEDDLGLLSNELEELEDDEVSLREAAFLNGYSAAETEDGYRSSEVEESFEEDNDYE